MGRTSCRALLPGCLTLPAPLLRPAGVQYRNPWKEARIGRILEDLDSLAGFVAFDHWWVHWCV